MLLGLCIAASLGCLYGVIWASDGLTSFAPLEDTGVRQVTPGSVAGCRTSPDNVFYFMF